ncbi:MAG: 1-deoxy-D-xylulose-5-phosphate reductoisomerase [Candidatus Izimaplasma sp.]|nr:1-deoxy-D-xylulose-5-phosphate reductoisomerase [Candidatus Izimaplasma bacterium]
MKKNIYLLGATGSIGQQTLDIIKKNPNKFNLVAFSGYNNYTRIIEIATQFKPEMVALKDKTDYSNFKQRFPDIKAVYGREGLNKLASYNKEDKSAYLVNALVGMVGLDPTLSAIKIERDILLANKETLVVGGHLINDLKKLYKFNLYPIDSEHNALWQLLDKKDKNTIKRLIITASGGAFRELNRKELETVNIEDALDHPNWSMGKKITIDSATMMNKGFEIIEACYLFDIDIEKVDTVIHKESIVHSMVEFNDGSYLAHLSKPDMHLPISYALFYPERFCTDIKKIEITDLNSLSFSKMDYQRYPCLNYAIEAFKVGGSMRTVLNAANEIAVSLFLNGKIQFLEIEKIIRTALDSHKKIDNPSLEQIYEIDNLVKSNIEKKYNR